MVPPRPEPRELTLPRPFNLRSEARHAAAVEAAAAAAAEAEAAAAEAARFHARELPRLDRVFVPQESGAPLTVPMSVVLATEGRAMTRGEFDAAVAEKARAAEDARRVADAAREAAEREEVQRLRRTLAPRATPMPDFSRPFMAMPSGRKLTHPVSPKFGRKGGKRGRGE
eukprot:366009-Chlamydomonas_euryale.AAC.40